MKRFRLHPLYCAVSLALASPCGELALAGDISYDGTLKGRTLDSDTVKTQTGKPNKNGDVWTVSVNKEGIKSPGGKNVFFSFDKFKVDAGETADFHCAGNQCGKVDNLISRVGALNNEKAEIFGRVTETGLNANFWMMSPNGVVLGESGKIDVKGSLHVGTGSSIEFPDRKFGKNFGVKVEGDKRTADPESITGNSTLDANPRSFGFLDGDDGTLEVGQKPATPGTDPLRLQAGGIQLAARQVNVTGNVEVAGTSGAGAADLEVAGGNLKPSVTILAGGRIVSAGKFEIRDDANGLAPLQPASVRVETGGELQAGALDVDRAVTVAGGSARAETVDAAGDVTVNGGGTMTAGTRLRTAGGEVRVGFNGSSGTVEGMDGKSLAVTGKAVIVQQTGSSIRKSGQGDLKVTATGSDEASSSGRALDVGGGGSIEASNAGSLTVDSEAGSMVLDGSAATPAIRKTSDGELTIRAGRTLTLKGGLSHDLAGNVTVEGGAVVVDGGTLAKSGRGNLKVAAKDADGAHVDEANQTLDRALTLRNGGRIEAANSEGGSLLVDSEAGSLVLDGSSLTPTIRKITDGDVMIRAGRTLTVKNGWSHGRSGDVALTGHLKLEGGAVVVDGGTVGMTGAGNLQVSATGTDGDPDHVDESGKALDRALTVRNGGRIEAANAANGSLTVRSGGAIDLEPVSTGLLTPPVPNIAKTTDGDLTIEAGRSLTVKSAWSHGPAGNVALRGDTVRIEAGQRVDKTGSGGLAIEGRSGVAVAGEVSHGGTGDLSVDGGPGPVAIDGVGLIAKTGSGALAITSQAVAVDGVVNHDGDGLLSVGGGSLAVGADGLVSKTRTGGLSVDTQGAITVDGVVNHAGDGELSVKGGSIGVGSAGSVSKTGTGGLTADASGSVDVAGHLSHGGDGALTVEGGSVTLDGAVARIQKDGAGGLSVRTKGQGAAARVAVRNGATLVAGGGGAAAVAGGEIELAAGGRIVGNNAASLTVTGGNISLNGGRIEKTAGGDLTVETTGELIASNGSAIQDGSTFVADPAAAADFSTPLNNAFTVSAGTGLKLDGGSRIVGNHDGVMTVSSTGGTVQLGGTGGIGLIAKIGGEHRGGDLTVGGTGVLMTGAGTGIMLGAAATDLATPAATRSAGNLAVTADAIALGDGARLIGNSAGDLTVAGGTVNVHTGRIVGHNGGALQVTGSDISLDDGVIEKTAGTGELKVASTGELTAGNGSGIYDGNEFNADPAAEPVFGAPLANSFTVSAGKGLKLDGGSRIAGNHDGLMEVSAAGSVELAQGGGLISKVAGAGRGGDLTVKGQAVTVEGGSSAILLGSSAADPGGPEPAVGRSPGSLKVEADAIGLSGGGQVIGNSTGNLEILGGAVTVADSRLIGNNDGFLTLSGSDIRLDRGRIEKTAGGDLTVAATGELTAAGGSGIYDGNEFNADPAAEPVFGAALTNRFTVNAGSLLQLDGGSRIAGSHDGAMEVTATGTVELAQGGGLISRVAGTGRGGDLAVKGQVVQVRGGSSAILLGSSAADPTAPEPADGRGPGSLKVEADAIGLSGGGQVIGNSTGNLEILGGSVTVTGSRIAGNNDGFLTVAGSDIRLDGGRIEKTAGGDLTVAATGELTAANGSGVYDGSVFNADPAAAVGFGQPLANNFTVGGGTLIRFDGGSRIVGNHDGVMTVRATGGTVQAGQEDSVGLISKIGGEGRGGDLIVTGQSVQVQGSAGGSASAIVLGAAPDDPAAMGASRSPGNLKVTADAIGIGGGSRVIGNNTGGMAIQGGTVTLQDGRIAGNNTGSLTVAGSDISLSGGRIEKTAGGDLTVAAGGALTAANGSGLYDGNEYAPTQAAAAFGTPLANAFTVSAGTLLRVDGGSRIVGNHDGAMTVAAPDGTVQVGRAGSVGLIAKLAGAGRGGLLRVTGKSVQVQGNGGGSRSAILQGADAADAAAVAAARSPGELRVEGGEAVGILDGAQVVGNSDGDLFVEGGEVTVQAARIAGNNGGFLQLTGSGIVLDGGVVEKTAGGDLTVAAGNDLMAGNGSGIYDGSVFNADPAAPVSFGPPLANNFTVSAGNRLQLDGGSRIVGNHDGTMTVSAAGDAVQLGQDGTSGSIAKIAQPGSRGNLTVSGPRVQVTGEGSAILLGASATDPSVIATRPGGGKGFDLPAPMVGDLLVEATGDDPARGVALSVTDHGRIVGNNKAGQRGEFQGDVLVRAADGSRGGGKKHRSTVSVDGGTIQKYGPGGDLDVIGGDVDIVDGGKVVMGNLATSGRGDGPYFEQTNIDADNLDRSTGKLTITALNKNSLTVGSPGKTDRASYVLSTSEGGIDLASGNNIHLGRGYIVENSGTVDGGDIQFRSALNGQPIRVTVDGFVRVMNIGAGLAGNSILFERGPSVMTFETGRSIFQTLTGPGQGGTNFNPLRYGWTVQDYQAAELAVTQDPLQDMTLPEFLSSVGFAATSQAKLGDFPTGIVRSLDRVVIGQWQSPIDLDSIVANPCGRPGSSLVMQGLAGYAAEPSATIPSPAGEPATAALGGGFAGAGAMQLAFNESPAAVECD